MKNELENDKTYLGDDTVRGFFILFLSLYLYYRILKMWGVDLKADSGIGHIP